MSPSDPVDLASYRQQRVLLAEKMTASVKVYSDALATLGREAAHLAWLICAPVRGIDQSLTRAVYRLVLRRLQRQSDLSLKGRPAEKTLKPQARGAIEDAFRKRLWELEDAADRGVAHGA